MGRILAGLLGLAIVLALPVSAQGDVAVAVPTGSAVEISSALEVPDRSVRLTEAGGKVALTVTAAAEAAVTVAPGALTDSLGVPETAARWWRSDQGNQPERIGATLALAKGDVARLVLEVPPLPAGEYRAEIGVEPGGRVFEVAVTIEPPPAGASLPEGFLQPTTVKVVQSSIEDSVTRVVVKASNPGTAPVTLGSVVAGTLTRDDAVVRYGTRAPAKITAANGDCAVLAPAAACLVTLDVPPLSAGEYKLSMIARGQDGGESRTEVTLQVSRPTWWAVIFVTAGVIAGAVFVAVRTINAPRNRLRARLRKVQEMAETDAKAATGPVKFALVSIREDAAAAERAVMNGEDRADVAARLEDDLGVVTLASQAIGNATASEAANRLEPLVTAVQIAIATTPRDSAAIKQALGQLGSAAQLVELLVSQSNALELSLDCWAGGRALPELILPENVTAAVDRAQTALTSAMARLTAELPASTRLNETEAALAALAAAEPSFVAAVRGCGLALLASVIPADASAKAGLDAARTEAAQLATAAGASEWARGVARLAGIELPDAKVLLEAEAEDAASVAQVLASALQPGFGTSSEALLSQAKWSEIAGVAVVAVLTGVSGHQALIGDSPVWGSPFDLLMAFVAGFVSQTAVAGVVRPE